MLKNNFSIFGCFYDNVTTTQPCFHKVDLIMNNKNEVSFRFLISAECKTELLQLNYKKPPWLSDLPAWALKSGCFEMYPHLTFLFKKNLKSKIFLDKFTKILVTPLYKKDNPESTKNYKQISKTGALSNEFEKIFYKQISKTNLLQKLLTTSKSVSKPPIQRKIQSFFSEIFQQIN